MLSKEIIRIAIPSDLPPIMEGINRCKKQLFFHGSGQWQSGEPNNETLQNDIKNRQYVVLERDGFVLGGMALLMHEPSYDQLLEGAWLNEDPYGVLHRFYIHPDYQQQGKAQQLFAWAIENLSQQGILNIRIDTHEKNVPMRKSLTKFGFFHVGKAYLPGAGERWVYHKVYEKK